jgi:hypothetical protein
VVVLELVVVEVAPPPAPLEPKQGEEQLAWRQATPAL